MRHQNKGFKLGRTHSHRKATLSALSNALIQHKRITTTLTKARALRMYVEPLINRSKVDTMHSRRLVFRHLQNNATVTELFSEIADRVVERPGGYTRVIKLGQRAGDSAEMAIIELVDYNDVKPYGSSDEKRKRTRRAGRKRSVVGASAAVGAEGLATDIADGLDEAAEEESSEIEEDEGSEIETSDSVIIDETVEATTEEEATEEAPEPAAEVEATEEAPEPVAEVEATEEAPEPAAEEEAAEEAPEPAAEVEAKEEAPEPAGEVEATEEAPELAAEEEATEEAPKPAPEPAAEEEATQEAPEPAAEVEATEEAPEPAAEEPSEGGSEDSSEQGDDEEKKLG